MKLHELVSSNGLQKKKNRRGRGDGSGRGNYSGKGCKGQKARSGGGVKPQFEGGQTSLFMRLPKLKGFKRHYKLVTDYVVINTGNLESDDRITSGDTITKQQLVSLGYAGINDKIKLLNRGTLQKKIVVEGVDAVSASAEKAIVDAGGSVSLAS